MPQVIERDGESFFGSGQLSVPCLMRQKSPLFAIW